MDKKLFNAISRTNSVDFYSVLSVFIEQGNLVHLDIERKKIIRQILLERNLSWIIGKKF